MNIDFEALSQIPQLLEIVTELKKTIEAGTIDKRWLNKQEMVAYSGYGEDALKIKRSTNSLVENIHYYKKNATTIIYDKIEIDNWIMGIRPANNNSYQEDDSSQIVDDILASIAS